MKNPELMLIRKLKFIFLLCGLSWVTCLPHLLWGQSQVSVRSTSRKILIGDQINVWLIYQQVSKTHEKIGWAILPDTIPGLTWVKKGKIDTLKTGDSIILKQQLTLTGFDSGSYYIPSFTFRLQRGDDSAKIIRTDSLLVQVQTIAVDTTKAFKPIKGVQQIPITWLDYWQYIGLGLVGLIIIAFLIIFFIIRMRRKPEKVTKVPPEKAHERALRLLSELGSKKLWQTGAVKEYYDQLSQISREYLQNRFRIPALEYTSEELLQTTHKMAELKPFRKQLRAIIQTSDLAKFARAKPLPEEHEACMKAAIEIVEKTKIIAIGEGDKK